MYYAVTHDNEGYGCGFYIYKADNEQDLLQKIKQNYTDYDGTCNADALLDENLLTYREINDDLFKNDFKYEVFENYC